MIIQIYEIQQPYEAEQIIRLGVDHIGSVIVSEDEWKDPLIKETVNLCTNAAHRSSLIPLFTRFDAVCRVIDYYQPHIIHFCETLVDTNDPHGHCSRLLEAQATIKETYPQIDIMRSIPIARQGFADTVPTLQLGKWFEPYSDYFLTDTFLVEDHAQIKTTQPVSGFIGITGKTCDWQTARNLVATSNIPVILAGGINPDNVRRGIEQVQPAGVDSCTGTNALDKRQNPMRFKKDMNRVKQLVDNARGMAGSI